MRSRNVLRRAAGGVARAAVRASWGVEPLEPRTLMAIDPVVDGVESIQAGSTYALSLNATLTGGSTLAGWEVDWGDGSGVESLPATAAAATHVFAQGGTVRQITARASDGTTWYAAHRPALDGSFGTAGQVKTHFGYGQDRAAGAAVLPDGRLLVAGAVSGPDWSWDFGVARYDAGGNPDSSFGAAGDGGRVRTSLGAMDVPAALLVRGDGRFLVVGDRGPTDGSTPTAVVAVRYLPDGAVDTAFAAAGVMTAAVPGGVRVHAAALDPAGRIVVAGTSGGDFYLARFTPDGAADTSFGAGGTGTVTTDLGRTDAARAIAVAADGSVVVAGDSSDPAASAWDAAVARYTAAGTPDPAFDGDGTLVRKFVAAAPGHNAYAAGVVVQPSGRVVVGGHSYAPSAGRYDLALMALAPAGAADTTFGAPGGGGVVVTAVDGAGTRATGLIAAPDGGLVLTSGQVPATGAYAGMDFGVARYTADGAADVRFDGDGRATLDWGQQDWATAAAVDPAAGHVVVAGYTVAAGSTPGPGEDFAVARFRGDTRVFAGVVSPPPIAPGTPVAAGSATSNSVTFTWADNSVNEEGFVISVSTDGTNFSYFDSVPADTTSYTASGLDADTDYWFKVGAENDAAFVTAAGVLSVRTAALPLSPPASPSGLYVLAGATSASVNWADRSGNEDGFVLQWSTFADFASATTRQIAVANVNQTGFPFTNEPALAAATGYFVRVAAYNTAGMSAFTAPARFVTVPSNFRATGAATGTTIGLAWDAGGGDSTFVLERRRAEHGGVTPGREHDPDYPITAYEVVATLPGSATGYVDTGLAPGRAYEYRLRAQAGGQVSGPYNTVPTALPPYQATTYNPQNPRVTASTVPNAPVLSAVRGTSARGGTNVTLSWGAAGADDSVFMVQGSTNGGQNWTTTYPQRGGASGPNAQTQVTYLFYPGANGPYTVKFRAYRMSGAAMSAPSAEQSVEIPAAGAYDVDLPLIQVTGTGAPEGGTGTLSVSRYWASSAVTVALERIGGNAGAGDYTGVPATASFTANGPVTMDFPVTVVDDAEPEPPEWATYQVTPSSNYLVGAPWPHPGGEFSSAAIGFDDNDAMDVDIDSDNNDGYTVSLSTAEEQIEDDAGTGATGKLMWVNSGDTDGDGVPGWADGFDLGATAADAASGLDQFHQMVVSLPAAVNWGVAKVRFVYDGSDPSDVQYDPQTGYTLPAAGSLRIWTADAWARRSAVRRAGFGWYVVPGVAYTTNEMGLGPRATFLVEAVRPAPAPGGMTIRVEVDPTGTGTYTAWDTVRLTAADWTFRNGNGDAVTSAPSLTKQSLLDAAHAVATGAATPAEVLSPESKFKSHIAGLTASHISEIELTSQDVPSDSFDDEYADVSGGVESTRYTVLYYGDGVTDVLTSDQKSYLRQHLGVNVIHNQAVGAVLRPAGVANNVFGPDGGAARRAMYRAWEIDPVESPYTDVMGRRLNEVANPAAIAILRSNDTDPAMRPYSGNVAVITITHIGPNFTFTNAGMPQFEFGRDEDNPQIVWRVADNSVGGVEFYDNDNTGLKIRVYGTRAGRVKLNAYLAGQPLVPLASYEAVVVEPKRIPFRFQLPGQRSRAGAVATVLDAKKEVAIANSYLWQMGILLVPEVVFGPAPGATEFADELGYCRTVVPDGMVENVSITPGQVGHGGNGLADQLIQVNARPNVLQIVHVRSLLGDTDGDAGAYVISFPGTNAGRVTTTYRVSSYAPSVAHTMFLQPGRKGGNGNFNWGILVNESVTDLARRGLSLAHEVGHFLGLKHRDVDPFWRGQYGDDTVGGPRDRNIMDIAIDLQGEYDPSVRRIDFDIAQVYAAHGLPSD